MSGTKDLYSTLLPALPENALPIVKASIDAVAALPGLESWLPQQVYHGEAMRIVQFGFYLTFLSSVDSVDPLRRQIASAILKNETPNPSHLAEINGAALCVALGATSIEHVKRSSTKTPDFRVSWSNDVKIDLEVTCAQEKPAHIERKKIASSLAKQIHDKERSHDIILHFVEPPEENEVIAIMEASRQIGPGIDIEQPGRWRMRAEKPKREAYTIVTGGEQDESPDWWPRQAVKNFVFYGFLAGPNATEPPPQTRAIFGVPFDAYINPVQNKADRPQRRVDKPFLIAIDIHNLPGAFRKFRSDLPEYFSIWKQLSGVLVFQSWFSTSKIGWWWELIVNPLATYPLPDELVQKQIVGDHHVETYVLLEKAEREQG